MKKILYILTPLVAAFALSFFAINCGEDDPTEETTEECTPACTGTEKCVDKACVDKCCTEGDYYMSITGMALDLAAGNVGTAVKLSPINATVAISSGTVSLIDSISVDSGSDGLFSIDCFDVETIAKGMIVLADDKEGSNTDMYFPTITGVKGWAKKDEIACTSGSKVFAIQNKLAFGLSALGFNADTDGFILGFVLDKSGNPMAGATVKEVADTALTVIYPNATLTDYAGTATSATGIFLIAGSAVKNPTLITGVKDGVTFEVGEDATLVKGIAGHCYVAQVVEVAE